jgi:hypothetical protein
MRKTIAILIAIIAMMGTVGATSATTAVFHGFNPNQSIGTAGIQNWQTNTGTNLKGLCVDAYTFITKGNHQVTTNTNTIKNANIVKLLIVKYYNPKMSKIDGYNLQYAIWYFTNGVKPQNAAQHALILSVQGTKDKIPDVFTQKLSSKTVQTSDKNTTTYTPISTKTTQNSIINLINSVTQVCKHGCYTIITTINHYSNTTTTNTTTQYNKTVTNTQTFKTTTNLKQTTFNSIIAKNTQKIILFTVKPITTTVGTTKTTKKTTPYANSTITTDTSYFCNQTTQIVKTPCKPKPPCKHHYQPCKPVKCESKCR